MKTTALRNTGAIGFLVGISLGCKDEPLGPRPPTTVVVDGGVYNSCPSIIALVIAPTRILVGAQATLDSQAQDPDNDELLFLWSTTSGSIADPTAARTTFTCTSPGESLITLIVADGHGCDDAYQAELECLSAVCGNGIEEAGEQCDDGDMRSGDGCSADCRLE